MFIGPQTSVWTNSKGYFARLDFLTNGILWLFQKMQALHNWSGWWIWGKPFTKFRLERFSKLWKFKCPKRKCHNHDSLFTIAFKHLKSPIWKSTGNMRFFDKKVLRIKLPFFIKNWELIFNYVHHVTLFGQLSHTQQITFHIRYIENMIDVPVITILQCDKNSPFSSHWNEPAIPEFHFCTKWVIQICKLLLLTTHMISATCIQIPSLIVWGFIWCGCH